jgi:hypothetical protein
LDVVWDPFDKVGGVLVRDVEHLLLHFFGWGTSSEESGSCKVATMSWISSTHHVSSIENLLSKNRNSQRIVLHAATWCKWTEASHEEVEPWEWYQIYSKLAKIRI